MKTKLIILLALVLSSVLFDRNSTAAIIFPKSPAGGPEMARQCANDCLQQTPSFFANEHIDGIRIAYAFQGYQCQPKDVMSGYLLSTAMPSNPVIWSYVAVHATNAVALVELMVDEKAKTGLKFAGMFGKGMAVPVLKAIHKADQLPEVANQNYEFRFLTVNPVLFAVWLHGKTNDIVIPLPLGSGKWKAYHPYSEGEIIQVLQPEVEKRMGSDGSARNVPFSPNNPATMQFGRKITHRHTSSVSPAARQIVQRMSDYYQQLSAFEGTNTITDQSPTFNTTRIKQFAFLRPNKFSIRSESTNDWQWICDGTNFYDYRPYYFNSYTKMPAPTRFEDALTNGVGGALVCLMVGTNRFHYIMNGLGWGLVALKDEGKATVDGVTCHHLLIRERGSRTAELWIAAGDSPHLVKYVFRFPATAPAKGVWTHIETISGWRANASIPPGKFAFVPPTGAIEHPSNSDAVKLSVTFTNGVEKRTVRFNADNEADNLRIFLKKNREHFQAIALKAILDKYTALTTNDLAFSNMEPSFPETAKKTFIVIYALPKTLESTNVNEFIETKEQTIAVTLMPDGNVTSVSRGYSTSFRSLSQPKQP